MSGDFCQREGTGAINLNGAAVSRVISQRKKWRRHRPAESHSLRDPRASASTQRMPMRVCYYSLRGTATALHGGKGKETSLLSIKMQRRADTAKFCNGSDLSSHACGSTEIGWTLSVWPPFWLEQIYAPSLSMADEREGLWRGQKVEVWFRLTSVRFVDGVFVQRRAFGTMFRCQHTGYRSNLNWKLAFLGCIFRAPFLVQGSFASSNQRPDRLSSCCLWRRGSSVNLVAFGTLITCHWQFETWLNWFVLTLSWRGQVEACQMPHLFQ